MLFIMIVYGLILTVVVLCLATQKSEREHKALMELKIRRNLFDAWLSTNPDVPVGTSREARQLILEYIRAGDAIYRLRLDGFLSDEHRDRLFTMLTDTNPSTIVLVPPPGKSKCPVSLPRLAHASFSLCS